jgi:hypothetical protein
MPKSGEEKTGKKWRHRLLEHQAEDDDLCRSATDVKGSSAGQ